MQLKRVTNDIRRYQEGDAWVDLKVELSGAEEAARNSILGSVSLPASVYDEALKKGDIRESELKLPMGQLLKEVEAWDIKHYVMAWSLADSNGMSIPVTEKAVAELDLESYKWIVAQIEKNRDGRISEADLKNLNRSSATASTGSVQESALATSHPETSGESQPDRANAKPIAVSGV